MDAHHRLVWSAFAGDPAATRDFLWRDMGGGVFLVLSPRPPQASALFEAPQDGLVYVTSRVDSRITALDPETLDVKRVHDVGGGPDCLTFDADGSIWATLRWVGRIANLDPRSGAVRTTRVGRSPHGILFTPSAVA